MSPTRKPKPPDKGAPPEHKPSRKVALEEVMRTLQDLVSNELAIEPTTPLSEPQATAAKTKKTVLTEKTPAVRSTYSADVLPTIPQAVVAPTVEPRTDAPEPVFPIEIPATIPDIDNELPDLGAEPLTSRAVPPATTGGDIPLGGLQQELPYLEATAPPAPFADLRAPTPEAAPETEVPASQPELLSVHDIKADIGQGDPSAVVAGSDAPIENTTVTAVEMDPTPRLEPNWDDIPVLEEAVDISEEIDVHATSYAPGRPSATNLPPTAAAHRLAIQVAARLNVELRKSGQGGLSSDVITRLARLLQEALAKGAPNMENTRSDKH